MAHITFGGFENPFYILIPKIMPIFTIKNAPDIQDNLQINNLLSEGSLRDNVKVMIEEVLDINNAILNISDKTLQFIQGSGQYNWPGHIIQALFELGEAFNIQRVVLYGVVNATEVEILFIFSMLPSSVMEGEFVGQVIPVSENPNLEEAMATSKFSQIPVKGSGIDAAFRVKWIIAGFDNTDTARHFNNIEMIALKFAGNAFATGYNSGHDIQEKEKALEEKEEALREALTDKLTWLPNRKSLDHALHKLVRMPGTKTVVVVDIDFFKHFNDDYGHHVGDLVLQHVACILKQEATRLWGEAHRQGGEEFVLIFPKSMTHEEIDSVRAAVESSVCELEWETYNVRISIGFVVEDSSTAIEPDASRIVKSADAALYVAKHNGRNRTEQGS